MKLSIETTKVNSFGVFRQQYHYTALLEYKGEIRQATYFTFEAAFKWLSETANSYVGK